MATIRYKLLTQNLISYNDCQWVLNEWKEVSGTGQICTSGWLHCYSDPSLAILMNPIHAKVQNPVLYKCEVDGISLNDKGLKEGWSKMRIVEKMELPQISVVQKIAFGILCALEVYKQKNFSVWANNWLSGKDRSRKSAADAYADADAAAAAYAAYAAYDAAYAAYAAACAADADAANAAAGIDFIAIIEKLITYRE